MHLYCQINTQLAAQVNERLLRMAGVKSQVTHSHPRALALGIIGSGGMREGLRSKNSSLQLQLGQGSRVGKSPPHSWSVDPGSGPAAHSKANPMPRQLRTRSFADAKSRFPQRQPGASQSARLAPTNTFPISPKTRRTPGQVLAIPRVPGRLDHPA